MAIAHQEGAARTTPALRPTWRAVAVPVEHGGWGLTLEPVLLGLLVAPSVGGLLLGFGALLTFLVRTPLKLVLVARRRGRSSSRTRVATTVAAVELMALAALGASALALAGTAWLVPVALAVPLVGVELAFEARSRGRRVVPELAGASAVAVAVAAIVIAGGRSGALGLALWIVLAARALASIPFVRVQIARLRHGARPVSSSDLAQLGAVALALAALFVDARVALGVVGVLALAVVHAVVVRRPPTTAKVLGLRQTAFGLALVALTATGVHLR